MSGPRYERAPRWGALRIPINREEVKHTMVSMTVVGSVILTVGAIIASWPTTSFLLQYFANLQNTGALAVGSFFSLLAVVLWVSAGWGWLKTWKNRTF